MSAIIFAHLGDLFVSIESINIQLTDLKTLVFLSFSVESQVISVKSVSA